VEAAHSRLLAHAEEDERRDRGAEAPGQVVPARRRHAAADALPLDERAVDSVVDGVADPGVGAGALYHPVTLDAPVLREEEDRIVRLVPGEPHANPRQLAPVGGAERAVVAPGGGRREALEVTEARRRPVQALVPVRPARRA